LAPNFAVEDPSGPDGTAPVLTRFVIAPQEIVVDTGPSQVKFLVSAADSGTGARTVLIVLRSASGQLVRCNSSQPADEGADKKTKWKCVASVPRYAEPGTWTVVQVTLVDRAGNQRNYTRAALESGRFQTTIEVISSTPDLSGPQLVSLVLEPQAIDVSESPQTVKMTTRVTDDLSGVQRVQFVLQAPSRRQSASCLVTRLATGDKLDGEWTCDVVIPHRAEAGEWRIIFFSVFDSLENRRDYTPEMLRDAGFPTHITVTSNNADTQPPTLIGLSFSPDSVSVATGSQTVTITFQVADAGSGVQRALISVFPPGGSGGPACLAANPAAGDRSNGTFACSITIPATAVAGDWQVSSMDLRDLAGNSVFFTRAALIAAGFPVTIKVTR
jgi:hypothetical protein